MKQPDLGIKIAELRKSKGLTQEELVDRCNISVRTLQRIEAGEVTPRMYTVKSIFGALEFDFNEITDNDRSKFNMFIGWFKRLLLIDADPEMRADYARKQLILALIFGVIYFIQFFFRGALEHLRYIKEGMFWGYDDPSKYYQYMGNNIEFSRSTYVFIVLIGLISFVYFQRGFILIGHIFQNYLLRIISFILILFTFLMTFYDIVSIFYDAFERFIILGGSAFALGVIGILYGVSLYRLFKNIGVICKFAGILEIIAGFFFLTVVLSIINIAIYVPAIVLKIIIIYKVMEILKSGSNEQILA